MESKIRVVPRRLLQILIIATASFLMDYIIVILSHDDSIWLGGAIEVVGSVMWGPLVGGAGTFISSIMTDYLTYGTQEYSFVSIFEAAATALIGVIYRRLVEDEDRFAVREIVVFNFVQILVNVAVLYLSTPPAAVLFFGFILEDWSAEDYALEMMSLRENTFSTCISVALIGTALLAACVLIRRHLKEQGGLSAAIRVIFKQNYIKRAYRTRAVEYSVGFFFAVGLTMVDGVVSGHILGTDALAATSLVFPLITFSTFVSTIITSGCSNLSAAAKGNGDYERSDRLFTLGLVLTVIMGLLQSVVFFLSEDLYFGYFSSTDEIEAFAREYYKWFVLVPPLNALTTFLDEIIASDGDDVLSNAGYLTSFAVNVGASIILSKYMGMAGLALGTALSFVCYLLVVAAHFVRKSNTYRIRLWFSIQDTYLFVRYSLKSNTTSLCKFVTSVALTKAIIMFLGSEYLIANTVLCAMLEIYEMLNGPSEAEEYMLATYNGEKNSQGLKILFNEALTACVSCGVVVSIALLLVPNAVLILYGIEDSPLNVELIKCIRYCGVGSIAASIGAFLIDFYGSTGKPLWSSCMAFFRSALFPILFCVTLCVDGGIVSMGIGMLLSQIVAVAIFYGFVLIVMGADSIPYMLNDPDYEKVMMKSFEYRPEEYEQLRRWIAENLAAQGIKGRETVEVSGLVLTLLKMTEEKNSKKETKGKKEKNKVLGECVLRFIDAPEIIIKDDGELFEPDISDKRYSYNVRLLCNCSTIRLQGTRETGI